MHTLSLSLEPPAKMPRRQRSKLPCWAANRARAEAAMLGAGADAARPLPYSDTFLALGTLEVLARAWPAWPAVPAWLAGAGEGLGLHACNDCCIACNARVEMQQGCDQSVTIMDWQRDAQQPNEVEAAISTHD